MSALCSMISLLCYLKILLSEPNLSEKDMLMIQLGNGQHWMVAICLMKLKEVLILDSQSFEDNPIELKLFFEEERAQLLQQYGRFILEFLSEKGYDSFAFKVSKVKIILTECLKQNKNRAQVKFCRLLFFHVVP